MTLTARDEELIDLRSNEFREQLGTAYCSGQLLAQQTVSWLKPLWSDVGLPVREGTDFPIISSDMLLHAGAITSIAMWEHYGFDKSVAPHVHTSDFALLRFMERVMSADVNQFVSDEGKQLSLAVSTFERQFSVPMSMGELDPGSSVVMVIDAPEPDGLDLLAELLLEFSGTMDITDHTHLKEGK